MKFNAKALPKVWSCLILAAVLFSFASPARGFNIKKIKVPGAHDTFVSGINDLGVIVGYYRLGEFDPYQGFLYDGVNFTTINYGTSSTYIYGINNAGHVVGECTLSGVTKGFKYDGSNFTPLYFENSTSTTAYSINDSGKIVGEYTLSGSTHGFTYDGQFETFDVPSGTATSCYGINNSDWIVGSFTLAGTTYGFIYDPIQKLFSQLQVPGAITTRAQRINDKGRIVGDFFPAYAYPTGFIYNGSSYQIIPNNYFGGIGNSLYAINKFGQMAGSYRNVRLTFPNEYDYFESGVILKSTPLPLLLLLD
jgi:hypothetical protein